MYNCSIGLKSINEVKEFSGIMNSLACEADLTSGKYVVDAKSIMGIFSLDLSGKLELAVHSVGDSPSDDVSAVIEQIKKFII